jgi:cytochrome c553
MRSRRYLTSTARHLLAALSMLVAGGAYATDAATIARQGNGHGAPPCQSCHGIDGAGQEAAGYPRLAGLDAGYLRRQLDDFASGARDNPVMKPTAVALSADERETMAGYYSRLPLHAVPAGRGPAVDDGTGALLATRGRWSKQVPACEQCHGPGGVGVGTNFPPLAGQPAAYIEAQLKAWKAGTRRNDPLQLMQHVSKSLDDADIAAVAAWFAARPLPAKGSTP